MNKCFMQKIPSDKTLKKLFGSIGIGLGSERALHWGELLYIGTERLDCYQEQACGSACLMVFR